ncbi:MAG: mannosyltransferase family protein [Acidimicrobiales bacterium]
MPGEAGRVPTLPADNGGPATEAGPAVGLTTEPGGAPASRTGAPGWQAAFLFLGIAAVLFVVAGLSVAHFAHTGTDMLRDPFPGRPWLEAWVHWDGGWYGEIAERGYWAYSPGQQGPVAFFPAYPVLMWLGGMVVGSPLLAGILLTLAAGAVAAGLFHTWLRARVSPAAAWTALLLFLLYPFAFYLYGVVYADAVFIAAAIGAFLLVERGHPWLAGLVGAIATAARPVGFVLVISLLIRVVELRGGRLRGWRNVPWRDLGVLLSGLGIGAFCLYCWGRFGNPLAFVEAQKGWDQTPGPATWLKLQFWEDVRDFRSPLAWLVFVSHPILTLTALALVPTVVRRYGWGYGSFALLGLGISAMSTKNFFGMSRYVLSAFPCFAAAGELLAPRARLRVVTLASSAVVLVAATSFFARGHYLS